MQIRLIRHGLTALSEAHRYQGALDTPLSETGKALLLPQSDAARVYHSPLLRAIETADILFPAADKIPVPDLREMDFGVFEGRGWWEMESDAAYRAWVDSGCEGQCPGGENRDQFSRRVWHAFSSLLESTRACGERELVIIAHGGTQMAILSRWGRPKRDYFSWQTKCGAGFLLEDSLWPDHLAVISEVCYTR